jgi:hypothetical protein
MDFDHLLVRFFGTDAINDQLQQGIVAKHSATQR